MKDNEKETLLMTQLGIRQQTDCYMNQNAARRHSGESVTEKHLIKISRVRAWLKNLKVKISRTKYKSLSGYIYSFTFNQK